MVLYARKRELIGIDYEEDTVKRFERTEQYAGEFIRESYGQDDIELKNLDYQFATGFTHWLKVIKRCSNNTVLKYFTTMKSVVIDAKKARLIDYDPFAQFSMSKEDVDVVPLSPDELRKISMKNLRNERLGRIRDVFVWRRALPLKRSFRGHDSRPA